TAAAVNTLTARFEFPSSPAHPVHFRACIYRIVQRGLSDEEYSKISLEAALWARTPCPGDTAERSPLADWATGVIRPGVDDADTMDRYLGSLLAGPSTHNSAVYELLNVVPEMQNRRVQLAVFRRTSDLGSHWSSP